MMSRSRSQGTEVTIVTGSVLYSSFLYSFKYFHTAGSSAALVPLFDRVTSLFGTIYSVFSLIRPNTEIVFFVVAIFGWRTFGASLFWYFCYLNVCNTEIIICG